MRHRLKVLIIGAAGFVGGYLRSELAERFGDLAEVFPTGIKATSELRPLDLTDETALREAISEIHPTHVVNLAGIAAPASARRFPELAWNLHAMAPERLGRVILEQKPDCWLLHVGSGLIYGSNARHGDPVDESVALAPMDPYGVTKSAGDLAIGALANQGLRCLRLRPFNHTGPGQTDDFAVPAFASQIAEIEAGRRAPVLKVGNLEAVRDFLHVRDVVAAYGAAIEQSDRLTPGDIYNVASGTGYPMQQLLDILVGYSRIPLTVEVDPARQRPSDLPAIVGDASKLRHGLGWAPRHDIAETLAETLDHHRALLAAL